MASPSSVPAARVSYIPPQTLEVHHTIDFAFQVMQHGAPEDRFKVALALAANTNEFLSRPIDHPEGARIARVLLNRINPDDKTETLNALGMCIAKFIEIRTFFITSLLATTTHETALSLRACLKNSTLPPATPQRTTTENRAIGYPEAEPFDHFLHNMTRRDEPRFPKLGLLFNDLKKGEACCIASRGDIRTNRLLSDFFGTLLDENTFLQVFGLMDGAYRVHSCDLTYHPDQSVQISISIYSSDVNDMEGSEAARFEATIPHAPSSITEPWIATINHAEKLMKGGTIALSLFMGWAAFLRTMLHVDEIQIPEAHTDAPLWAEKSGFTYENKAETLETIKRTLEAVILEYLDPEDPQKPYLLRQLMDATSLEDIAAIQTGDRISGKQIIREHFKPAYSVDMRLNIRRADMRRDPFPQLVQNVNGINFIPVEISHLKNNPDTKGVAEDFLHHHGKNVSKLMQSDENLADAIIERLNNWALQGQKESKFLWYVASILAVVAENTPLTETLLRLIETRAVSDPRSAFVFAEFLVTTHTQGYSIANPFLAWAQNWLEKNS